MVAKLAGFMFLGTSNISRQPKTVAREIWFQKETPYLGLETFRSSDYVADRAVGKCHDALLSEI